MENKYLFIILALLVGILLINLIVFIDGSAAQRMLAKISAEKTAKKSLCTTIQDGSIYTTDGELINTGYSEWGYNYQGDMFNGMYCDYHPMYRPGGAGYESCQENYGNDILMMKWNDAWLSNKDCDGDGLLDRHRGHDSYIGSGAWLTNHMRGVYEEDGESCSWNYFVKIVAAPSDAYTTGNTWYLSDGTELGEVIWGSFATIQSIYNDTCTGEHGVEYLSPAGPGFGKF
jgi:hypothetical protein